MYLRVHGATGNMPPVVDEASLQQHQLVIGYADGDRAAKRQQMQHLIQMTRQKQAQATRFAKHW